MLKSPRLYLAAIVIFLVAIAIHRDWHRMAPPRQVSSADTDSTWASYGGDEQGHRYSDLSDIYTGNIGRLSLAWEFSRGDFSDGHDGQSSYENEKAKKTSFQVTPLFVEDKIIYCTPFNRVLALNPETGAPLWSYDGALYKGKTVYTKACRGVSYWKNPNAVAGQKCASRIIFGTMGAKLIELDTNTGELCGEFGDKGVVDLTEGMGQVEVGDYYITSPPAIFQNLAIVGGLVVDNQSTESPSGVIRAFDLETGRLVWAWDPVPSDYLDRSEWKAKEPDTYGRYVRGSPNSWSVMSVDTQRGLVFVPTGNPGADYFKDALKPGIDRYGSSVVALNAANGHPIWDFKLVRRDVWDYDMAAQPVLFTQKTDDGRETPAVIAASKVGHVFILNRETGTPVFGVREIQAPHNSDSGELLSATQIEPVLPKPLHPYNFSIDDLPFLYRSFCKSRFQKLRFDGTFTPPSQQGSLQFPSPIGGINWGSVSVDEKNQIMITNFSVQGLEVTLVPRDKFVGGGSRFNGVVGHEAMKGTPYGVLRVPFALETMSIPCVPGPWGKIVAINLKNGQTLWEKPLGSMYGMMGLPNMGGSLITAGRLVFIGASIDAKFRAFDLFSGDELWSYALHSGGQATPMTYRYHGKQYVLIADGGHGGLGTSSVGDRLVAFTLK